MKKIYTTTQKYERGILNLCFRKATTNLVVIFGLIGSLSAQEHDHDSLRIMNRNDFAVSIVSSSNNQLQFEKLNKQIDSITPLFIELSAGGFLFSDDCILHQSINNVNVESNIEKIWGPEFVSLGLGYFPPNGRFVTDLAILNGLATGSYIKVRIYGSINGHDILWSGIVKN